MDEETSDVWLGQLITLQAAVVALFAVHYPERALLRQAWSDAFEQARRIIREHDSRGQMLDAAEALYEKLTQQIAN